MDIMESVFDALRKQNVPRDARWLHKQFGKKLKVKPREIERALDKLEDAGRIYSVGEAGYLTVDERYVSEGVLAQRSAARTVVFTDDGEELVVDMPRRVAFPGERVRVIKQAEGSALLISVPDELPEEAADLDTVVVDIDRSDYTGRSPLRSLRYLLAPLGYARRTFKCELKGLDVSLETGDIVRVRLMRRPLYGEITPCLLVSVAEDAGELKVYTDSIEDRYELSEPDELDAAAHDLLIKRHTQGLAEQNRRDLRRVNAFTIDGDTAKDFDDAVSIERCGDATVLSVHIADVAHFVRPGTALDTDARRRGTSTYLPWHTYHMLPEAISCDMCSLMPDVDRLAITCEMTIDAGRVTDYSIYPSIIHSKARLTYNRVNALFGGDEAKAGDMSDAVRADLALMRTLSGELKRRLRGRGYIEFESDEVEFELGDDGWPTAVIPRVQGEAEDMIEQFMLIANQTVAAHMLKNGLGCIYRVHERPAPESVAELAALAVRLNVEWHTSGETQPRDYQRLLEKTADLECKPIIERAALRSLKKAKYSDKPLGHFGLALKDYCHFTSPIRRYPDLIVHRLLHYYFDGEAQSEAAEQLRAALCRLASECSATELNATGAEREADSLMQCAYMARHIGERFDATVSGMSSALIFVTLSTLCEGTLPLRTLNDYYAYDDESMRLVSDRGDVIAMGQSMRVEVKSASLAEGKVYCAPAD